MGTVHDGRRVRIMEGYGLLGMTLGRRRSWVWKDGLGHGMGKARQGKASKLAHDGGNSTQLIHRSGIRNGEHGSRRDKSK